MGDKWRVTVDAFFRCLLITDAVLEEMAPAGSEVMSPQSKLDTFIHHR